MRFLKRVSLLTLCALLLVTTVTGCTSSSSDGSEPSEATETKVWKIGHIRPEGTTTDKDVKLFVSEVEKRTNGKIKIEVYPNSQLGDYTVVQERVGIGDIEMQMACLGTTVDKALGITAAPYLVSNWEEARQVYNWDSKLTKAIAELLEKQGIKLLAIYPKYFGGIALAKEPTDPGNPDISKNIKIRVPPMKAFEETAKALGYIATPLPWAEVFTAMQTGIVDGAIGSGAEGYYNSLRELTKYYLPVNSHFECWYLYMNLDLWNSLSPEEQQAIQEAADVFQKDIFDRAEKEAAKYEDLLREAGVEVYSFTDEELKGFAEKVRREVWPVIEDEYGREFFRELTKDLL